MVDPQGEVLRIITKSDIIISIKRCIEMTFSNFVGEKLCRLRVSCEWEVYTQHFHAIDLLAILEKSLDRALFLYIFIREVRSSGVRAYITIVHIRKFFKL